MRLKNYKKFAIFFVVAVPLFIAVNYIIWINFTEFLLTTKHGTGGDLARTGYICDSKQFRRDIVVLPKRHISFKEFTGQPVDLLTIGDSFSNGGGEGKNKYYQDYIATLNNLTVLNMMMYNTQKGPLETISVLINSGLLDKIKPKAILVQSVERFCIDRFAGEIKFNETDDAEVVTKHYNITPNLFNYLPKVDFINNGNAKYIYYRLLYLFIDSPTKNVRVHKLSKSLFNVKNDKTLLFFRDDARDVVKTTPESIDRLNRNMNKMAEILEKRGIKLYFMPVVDKYDLYSEFIINNPYQKSTFFEELRKVPKRYEFIDTKEILLEAVRRGEKDIFYADDTHWSWRAAELIFNRVHFSK